MVFFPVFPTSGDAPHHTFLKRQKVLKQDVHSCFSNDVILVPKGFRHTPLTLLSAQFEIRSVRITSSLD